MRDVFSTELRQALRVFHRSPGFVASILLTLAVGIGGTTAIFSLVNGLLIRPIPGVDGQDRILSVQASEFGGAFGVSSYVDYLDFVERGRSFESMTAFKPRQVDAVGGGSTDGIRLPLTPLSNEHHDRLRAAVRAAEVVAA